MPFLSDRLQSMISSHVYIEMHFVFKLVIWARACSGSWSLINDESYDIKPAKNDQNILGEFQFGSSFSLHFWSCDRFEPI